MENKHDKTTIYGYFTVKYKAFRKELQRLANKVPVENWESLEDFAFSTEGMTEDRTGYICVRLERPPRDSDSQEFRASFSFCAPEDWQKFSRPKARQIADSRMKSQHFTGFTFKRQATTKLPDLFRAALVSAEVTDADILPDWYEVATTTGETLFGIYDTVGKQGDQKNQWSSVTRDSVTPWSRPAR